MEIRARRPDGMETWLDVPPETVDLTIDLGDAEIEVETDRTRARDRQCPGCGGTGIQRESTSIRDLEDPCSTCDGSGSVVKLEEVTTVSVRGRGVEIVGEAR